MKTVSAYYGPYWTKMYPIALMCWAPSLPHVLEFIVIPSSAKPDPGVTVAAIVLVVYKDTNPCFRPVLVGTNYIESFLVTVGL